jgi:sigma-B regulation protein RsbU (phosphoserine phosphatase)
MARRLQIPLLVFIAAIVALEFPGVRDLVTGPYSGIETLNLTVQNVDQDGPNASAGIELDDEITHVEGVRVRNQHHLRAIVQSNSSLAPLSYTLLRDGRAIERTVHFSSLPTRIVYRRFALLLVGFTFLCVGLLVLVRRGDSAGTLFALNCSLLAFFVTDRPVVNAAPLQLIAEFLDDITILVFPAVFLHFFLTFHDRPRGMSRRERIRRYIAVYAAPALLLTVSSIFAVVRFRGGGPSNALVQVILLASTAYMAVYLIASLFIFIRNYRASSVGQRQKLRVAILGTVVGIVPFLAMVVWRQFSTEPHEVLEFLSVLALGFVSISFAYAILKYGAIEVNIVVRKSLMYAVLTGVIIAGYYTVVNLVGDYVTRELRLGPTYFSFATVLVLAIIFAPARDVVQRITDRIFFRGEYDYSHEVVEFSRELTGKLRKEDIWELFFTKADTLLHASYVVYYSRPRDGSDTWPIERASGDCDTMPSAFPPESSLARYLTRYRRPLMVEFLDHAWGKRHLTRESADFLRNSRAAVCVPVGNAESLMGLVVLGPKRSGQLYNPVDSNLLARFAEHLTLVLDNAELHEATVEQERLKNEVLLARDIQLSLLPAEPPQHPALTMFGKMISSVEVGGDYFDYFMLDEHRAGVAIGDGTGKGVPAAMLMSSLQAVFKNLALQDNFPPADLLGELNRHLCSSAGSDQFATFLYGILDTRAQTFTFSNAGHCPALLCKSSYVDRLGEGGLPLGVDAEHRYEAGSVRLVPGDIVCMYTDGVTEQADGSGDQFGEARLIDLLQSNRNLPLPDLHELLFATVQQFGGGRVDDDLTCVIASYKNG